MAIAKGSQMLASDILGMNFMPIGTILMYDGSEWGDNSTIPGWYVCDGKEKTLSNGSKITTPNLVNKFLRGSTSAGGIGGANTSTKSVILPQHNHIGTGLTISSMGPHTHGASGLSFSGDVDETGEHKHELCIRGGDPVSNPLYGLTDNIVGEGAQGATGNRWTALEGSHSHTITGSISGATGSGGAHTHTLSGNTANTGTANATITVDTVPAYYSVIYIRKCENI